MAKQAVAVTIEERTEALRKERGDNVSVDDIGSVVLSLVEGTAPDNEVDKIASELRDLWISSVLPKQSSLACSLSLCLVGIFLMRGSSWMQLLKQLKTRLRRSWMRLIDDGNRGRS